MGNKYDQPRRAQTLYSQTNGTTGQMQRSAAGSRGSVSPGVRPAGVIVHNGGGQAPKDEPRSSQVESDKVYR